MIAVIGDRETVTGFRLAGVSGLETDGKNLEQNMESVRDRKIVLINERLYKMVKKWYKGPVLVPIPDKHGPVGIDTVKMLIREIVGGETEWLGEG